MIIKVVPLGLDVVLKQGGTINFAIRAYTWPGRAAVEVSLVSVYKGPWKEFVYLDGVTVSRIGSYLDNSDIQKDPLQLVESTGQSFKGSEVVGNGFVMTKDEADFLVTQNDNNRNVIFPYLSGDDLNSRPDQKPSRYVINFFNWELEEVKKKYPDCYDIVLKKVKPERDNNNNKRRREIWWQFSRPTLELYDAIKPLSRVFAISEVTKYCTFSVVPKDCVYMQTLKIIAMDKYSQLATLCSTVHEAWGWKYSSRMGSATLRYTPKTAFETFPFPVNLKNSESLNTIGKEFCKLRCHLMLKMQLGLTKTYNLFHNPDLSPETVEKASKQSADTASEAYENILKLRELHRQMDEAVLAAYGWREDSDKWGPAIELRHDFYEVDYLPENDRTRYTIHPDTRREILKRLLLINYERYAEEVKQGLHDKKTKKKKATKKKLTISTGQQSLL